MKLTAFRIQNYRSVNDSGWINAGKMTALVGRNESGKSNLLLALASLNPKGGPKPLSKLKDFPNDRNLDEHSDDLVVVETKWDFESQELDEIERLIERKTELRSVQVSRAYKNDRLVDLVGFEGCKPDRTQFVKGLRAFDASIEVVIGKSESPEGITQAYEGLKAAVLNKDADDYEWAQAVDAAAKKLRVEVEGAGQALGTSEERLEALEQASLAVLREDTDRETLEKRVLSWLPTFIYVEDFTNIAGTIDVNEYVNHRGSRQATDVDINFRKLCKVAGLSPEELISVKPEQRALLTNRASAQISKRIQSLWSDRRLQVDLRIDGNRFDIYVLDPNSDYPVLVNLDNRSRGLRWFFSFFITYLADTNEGEADNAILLLDEPGLFLHAGSQKDLLKFLSRELPIQSIYTTHSPFMIPADDLDVVRTVNINQAEGTVVSNDPNGDQKTLFPIQAALGYSLAQSLFVGPKNVVVEGVTDYWILSAVSAHLEALGRTGLHPDAALTPAGGAQKVPYMVSLLTSQELDVVVLLDDEQKSRQTGEDLAKNYHFDRKSVVFVTQAFGEDAPSEADIEDLLPVESYLSLAKESHSGLLKGALPPLNENIPRIVMRLEKAYEGENKKYLKTKSARLFLNKMGSQPELVLDDDAINRFERLFKVINQRLG